jgi:5-methylthioribose kinase
VREGSPLYQPLDERGVAAYVAALRLPLFAEGEELRGVDLADGNVNLVYRVESVADPLRRVIVKQALPYARVVGASFPMPLDRARIEARALTVEGEICPGFVPKVLRYDPEQALVVMEDLSDHLIMRKGLIRGIVYPHVGRDLGHFLARTLFYTSDLFLDPAEKKARVVEFMNPGLCRVTEDLVFTHPYEDHEGNRWNPAIDDAARAVRADQRLKEEIATLKFRFMTEAQALIHGDLHTGSVMLTPDDTKVIDPEFAFYGPMGFDVGALFGNLAIAHAAQAYHAPDEDARQRYRTYIESQFRELWDTFAAEFVDLWRREARPEWPRGALPEAFLLRVLRDAAGFGGTKMLRRVLGLAHVEDLESIPDLEARAAVERRVLAIGRSWILERGNVGRVDDLLALMAEGLARPLVG